MYATLLAGALLIFLQLAKFCIDFLHEFVYTKIIIKCNFFPSFPTNRIQESNNIIITHHVNCFRKEVNFRENLDMLCRNIWRHDSVIS